MAPNDRWAKQATRALLFASSLAASLAHAGTIYKWVDESGVTQLSDRVPERFKNSAKAIDSSAYELSDRDKRQAAAEASRLVGAAASASAAMPASAPAAAGTARIEPKTAIAAGPTECEKLFRAFFDSAACFDRAPKAMGGIINAARSPQCTVVVDPSPKCGTPVLPPRDRRTNVPIVQPGDENRWSKR